MLLTGCGDPASTTSAPAPAVTANATPVDASPTNTTASAPATTAGSTAAHCPAGEYTLVSFAVVGVNGSLGAGSGGDVSVEFTKGRYQADFDEDTPISMTTGSSTGQLRVDGEIKGSYTGSGDSVSFKLDSSKGTATIKGHNENVSRSLKMAAVAKVLGLNGKGAATCSGENLTLKISQSTFELVRDND